MKGSALKSFRQIAAEQAQNPPKADKPDAPVLRQPRILEASARYFWYYQQARLAGVQLEAEKDDLAGLVKPALEELCEQQSALLTCLRMGATVWSEPETGQCVELEEGDVQWIQQVKPAGLEIGSKSELLLSAGGRSLMPERIELAVAIDPADQEAIGALMDALGADLLRRYFRVRRIRQAMTTDQARDLWASGKTGRRTFASLQKAGALAIQSFPKVAHSAKP